jgi:hypothetical protein
MIIKDFPNYSIDVNGVITNIKTGKEIKSWVGGTGYLQVNLYHKGSRSTFKLHRLVADTFIPNPIGLPVINHRDGNKLNNTIDNLEWTTQQDNVRHGVMSDNIRGVGRGAKIVEQYTLDGEMVNEFISCKIAAEFIKGIEGSLRNAASGRQKTYKSFVWKYKED